ncbi:MAG: hypothetical protein ACW96S_04250 [Promethearchaeota archaeon]
MEETMKETNKGYISAINGSLVNIRGLENSVKIHSLIKVEKHDILAEVIQIFPDHIIAQCFENTMKVKLNEKVVGLNEPLSMELGPGLIASVFDGIQRPLEKVFEDMDSGKLDRGIKYPPLSREHEWHFIPLRKVNEEVDEGDIIGTVQETEALEHKIMVPPKKSGKISYIAEEGDFTIIDVIYRLSDEGNEKSFSMLQKWPVTNNRPFKKKENPNTPLITGTRVIDKYPPITTNCCHC